jgi:hypothetical protein
MDGVRSKFGRGERLTFVRKPKAKNTSLEHLDVDGRIFKQISKKPNVKLLTGFSCVGIQQSNS